MDRATKQTGSWMWSRNLSERSLPVSQIHTAAVPAAASSYGYESWEERAFAEDSAGRLGACIWPPRSYTCSFCRREFRSAQALGGHMNVHRRDRARLNQSCSDINSGDSDHDDRHQNSDSKPIPYCSDPDSPLFPRVSALTSTPEVSIYDLFSHSCSSPIIQESQVESCFTTTGSSMDPVAARQISTPGLKLSSESLNRRDLDNDDDHDEIGKKRRRRTDVMFDISMRSSSAIQQKLQTEVFKLSPCPVEELDLELRLGCYSKVSQKRKACCG